MTATIRKVALVGLGVLIACSPLVGVFATHADSTASATTVASTTGSGASSTIMVTSSSTSGSTSTDSGAGASSFAAATAIGSGGLTCPLPKDADLAITKAADVATTTPGGTIHYTLTAKALGPAASLGAEVTDHWPIGITFVSAAPSKGSYASSTGIWNIGDLAASSTATLAITATVNTSTPANTLVINTAAADESLSVIDPNAGNNFAEALVTVVPGNGTTTPTSTTPLTISPALLPNGTEGTAYGETLTVSGGPGPFTWTLASGTLPDGLVLNASTTAATTTIAGTPTVAGTFSFVVGAANSATSTTRTYSITVVTSTCTTDCGGGGGTPNADVAITKTADVTSTVQGGTVNYLLTVSALGPATSTGVVATDTLPANLVFDNATASVGTYATSTGTWMIGDIGLGSTATLAIRAAVSSSTPAGTTILNTAIVGENASTTDNNPGNNSSTVPIVIATSTCTTDCGGTNADIAIQKKVDNANPPAGGTVNYLITATDFGPASATFVVAHDILPNGVSYVSATTSQGTYNMTTGDWDIGTVAPNATATLAIAAMVGTNQAGNTIVNTATVSSTLASLVDPDLINNSSSVSIVVQSGGGGVPQAGLTITKTADVASTTEGGTINYLLTVDALGPATSTAVVATDTFPSGLTFVNATASVGSYASSTGTWTIGDMSPSSTATLAIQATVNAGTAGTTIVNATIVGESASTTNPNSNNSSTVPVVINPAGCTSNCGGGGGGGGGGITVSVGGGGAAYDIAINNGASSTATTSVTLSLYGTGAYTMAISNEPFPSSTATSTASSTAGDTGWIPYATTMPWTLLSGAGEKTVYARYRDISGNILATVNASIELLGGQVLGVSTSCGIYLNDYIHLGWDNDPNEVAKLQIFLNQNLGMALPVTGVYSAKDFQAVEQFQVKYSSQVLAPWVPLGLPSSMTPTGFVYQTTKRWINMLQCQALNLPIPVLHVYGT